jgi:outer membrane protein assembly factor BamB
VYSSPAVVGGLVYVGSYYNWKVYCLNAVTGALVWSYTTGGMVDSSPAVVNGVVYVGSYDGKVYAFGPGVHDVAVTSVTPSKTVVGQGFSGSINVTAANHGSYAETFKVTVYANTTSIASQNITLSIGQSDTTTFVWNTTSFAKGNYTISAYAWPVPGETNTADNTYTNGTVLVTIPGDVNGDRKIDLKDVFAVGKAYGSVVGDPRYNPNLDINGDGKIDLKDYFTACKNYGKSW